jgi:hypothetical protein
MGFGRKVELALDERRQQLIGLGLATQREDGAVRYQSDILATLQRRELTASESASPRTDGVTYVPA